LTAGGRPVPAFDPNDGGADARLLLLLETPGPGPTPLAVVSRDNPAGTARNLSRFLAAADIARADTLLWNLVPWLLHAPGARNRAPTRSEIADGLATLPALVAALPRLRVVVLAGRVAARGEPVLRQMRPALPVLTMPHPSPTYVCTDPAIPLRIAATLAAARAVLA
jgi:uracil-DNA glycosylase